MKFINNKKEFMSGKASKRGFTFLEVIIATFIFVMAMIMISQLFGSGNLGIKKSRSVQKDLETAQQAINILAKTLRTSAVISPTAGGSTSSIIVYDYSRVENNCIAYEFEAGGNALRVSSVTVPGTEADQLAYCAANAVAATQNMTSGRIYGNFYIVPNNPTATPREIGRLVISMRVCLHDACTNNPKDESRLQTTVSLRNYEETN